MYHNCLVMACVIIQDYTDKMFGCRRPGVLQVIFWNAAFDIEFPS